MNAARIVEDLLRRKGVIRGDLSFIEMNRSTGERSSLALIVFARGEKKPGAFVKVTSHAGQAGLLRSEYDNLQRLTAAAGADLARSVPAPLCFEKIDDLTIMVESARGGARMKNLPPDRYYRSKRFRDHAGLVLRWLREFRDAISGRETRWSRDEARARASAEVEDYLAHHRASSRLSALLERSVAAIGDGEFPCSPWHGDFCSANIILADDGGLFVVDWEYPLDVSWPLSDLLHFFASTWGVPYRKGLDALISNYRCLFFERHAFSELLRRGIDEYAEHLGLEPRLILPASVLSWTAYANRKRVEVSRLGPGESAVGHTPLVMVEDGRCLNLELLAEGESAYLGLAG